MQINTTVWPILMTTIKKTDQNRLFGKILGLPVEFSSNNTSAFLC